MNKTNSINEAENVGSCKLVIFDFVGAIAAAVIASKGLGMIMVG